MLFEMATKNFGIIPASLKLRQKRIDHLNDLRSKMAFIQDNEDRKAVMDEIIALEIKLGYRKKLKEVI
jgi:hypothetical protein